jgi:hypothetical protein
MKLMKLCLAPKLCVDVDNNLHSSCFERKEFPNDEDNVRMMGFQGQMIEEKNMHSHHCTQLIFLQQKIPPPSQFDTTTCF